MKLVAVSDVTLGYGSPQLPLLLESLRDLLGGSVHIIEPRQPELAPKHSEFPAFQITPVESADHPHSVTGRQEFVVRATREVNRLSPDLLVICCTYTLPVLFQLRRRPKTVIYYSIESIPFYGEFDVEMNRRIQGLVDLILFPEQNRATLETARCGFSGIPKLVVYNTSNRRATARPPLPPSDRNGRILYAGTISRAQTFLDYYFSDKIRALPIDMFGPIKGTAEDQQRFLSARGGELAYRGRVGISQLAELRRHYLYSIVAWNPDQEGQLYAAPNKFFEAIADGVPPIAAPHPQCKLLIDRYGCGVLLEDWSFDAFHAGLRRALRDAGTPRWQAMVDACRQAVETELTWDAQFDKLKAHLHRGNSA